MCKALLPVTAGPWGSCLPTLAEHGKENWGWSRGWDGNHGSNCPHSCRVKWGVRADKHGGTEEYLLSSGTAGKEASLQQSPTFELALCPNWHRSRKLHWWKEGARWIAWERATCSPWTECARQVIQEFW